MLVDGGFNPRMQPPLCWLMGVSTPDLAQAWCSNVFPSSIALWASLPCIETHGYQQRVATRHKEAIPRPTPTPYSLLPRHSPLLTRHYLRALAAFCSLTPFV